MLLSQRNAHRGRERRKCSKSRLRAGCLLWRLGRLFSHRLHSEMDSPLQQQHLQEYNLQLHRLAVLVHKQILPGQMHRASQHLSIRLKNQFRRNQFHLPHLPELTIYKLHLIQKPVLPLHEDHIEQVARRLKSVEILSAKNHI